MILYYLKKKAQNKYDRYDIYFVDCVRVFPAVFRISWFSTKSC